MMRTIGSDKPAFETVYETYYDKIYRCAYTILLNRENAEDVVAETFLAAYAAYRDYDPARASLATWLSPDELIGVTGGAALPTPEGWELWPRPQAE